MVVVMEAALQLEKDLESVRDVLAESASAWPAASLALIMANSSAYQGEQLGCTLATAHSNAGPTNMVSMYNVDLSLPTPLQKAFKVNQFHPVPSVMYPDLHVVSGIRIPRSEQGARQVVLQAAFDRNRPSVDEIDVAARLMPLAEKIGQLLSPNVSRALEKHPAHFLLKNQPPRTPNFGLITFDKIDSSTAAATNYPALMTDLRNALTKTQQTLGTPWNVMQNTGDGDIFVQKLPPLLRLNPAQLAAYKRRELGPKMRAVQAALGPEFRVAATTGYVTIGRGQKPTSPAFWTLNSRLKERI